MTDTNVNINLTADDKASPTIQRLMSRVKSLEKSLNDSFKNKAGRDLFSSKLTGDIVKNKGVLDYLEKHYDGIQKITKSRRDWARAERDAGRMTEAGYAKLLSKVRQIEDLWNGKSFGGRGSKERMKEIGRLVQQARAYQAVWNETYDNRMKAERRLEDARAQLHQAVSRREQKAAKDNVAQAERDLRKKERAEREAAKRARRERDAVLGGFRRGGGQLMGAVGRLDNPFFNSPFFYASIATGVGAAVVRGFLDAAKDLDTQEIFARVHMGLDASGARDLRNRSIASGIANGINPSEMLGSTVEAAKAGVPDALAEQASDLFVKLSKPLGMSVKETTDAMGYAIAQEMGAGRLGSGPQALDGIRQLGNMVAGLASSMATTPQAMMSFMRTGMGSGAMGGMDAQHTLAFGAAATSLGAQGQQASRFLGHLFENMDELPLKAKEIRHKRHKSQKDKLFLQIPEMLGYGSFEDIEQQLKDNPNEAPFELIKRFGRIKDNQKRDQAVTALFGADFKRFLMNMIASPGVLDEAIAKSGKFRNEGDGNDFKSRTWKTWQESLQYFMEVIEATGSAFKEEMGDALKPYAEDFANYVQGNAGAIKTIKYHFQHLLAGLVQGFGYKNFQEMLEGLFGRPGQSEATFLELKKTMEFGRGFASGLVKVWQTVRDLVFTPLQGIFNALTGNEGAEGLGKFIAEILGFSVALHFLRPAIGLIGGIGLGLSGLFSILKSAAWLIGIRSAANVAGAAGSAAGSKVAFTGLAQILVNALTKAPLLFTIAGAVAGAFLFVKILEWSGLDKWWEKKTGKDGDWESPVDRRRRQNDEDLASGKRVLPEDHLKNWLKELFGTKSANADELPLAQQLAGMNGTADALHPLARLEEVPQTLQRINTNLQKIGAQIQLASLSTAGGVGGAGGGGFGGGSNGSGNSGMKPGSTFKPGFATPSWLGGGGGKGLLDVISQAEGTTKEGYNTVLGNGKYGRPDKPLTDMSLTEAFKFGRTIKARHGSSSAIGRYQIVGNTMMDAARALGMDPSTTKFDEATQDKMALWIARNQGLGAWEGLKNTPGAMAAARAAIAGGGGGIGAPGNPAGLPIKSAESIAGGPAAAGVMAAARNIVADGLPGGVNRFTAFNDAFHQNRRPNSKHTKGLAGDVTLQDPRMSAQAADALRNKFRGAGLTDDMFKVIDEYKHSTGGTGGHLHYQFNSPQAATMYNDFVEKQKAIASQGGAGIASGVPTPPARPVVGGGGGGGGNSPNVHIQIHGGQHSPEELANLVQRRITEAWNHRSHDMEPELT